MEETMKEEIIGFLKDALNELRRSFGMEERVTQTEEVNKMEEKEEGTTTDDLKKERRNNDYVENDETYNDSFRVQNDNDKKNIKYNHIQLSKEGLVMQENKERVETLRDRGRDWGRKINGRKKIKKKGWRRGEGRRRKNRDKVELVIKAKEKG